MATFDVAHMREQGIDLVIILLGSSFGNKTQEEQSRIQAVFQECATAAGLIGTVVPVWDAGGDQMGFLAPKNWHSFFSSLNLAFIVANINRKLTCVLTDS